MEERDKANWVVTEDLVLFVVDVALVVDFVML